MMVGTKAIATLSTGYLNALDYAKIRVQGADMTQMATRPPRGRDHPPPRRAPDADGAEGPRRGHARAGASTPVGGRTRSSSSSTDVETEADEDDDHAVDRARTTCCCRSSRATARRSSYELLALSLQTFGGSGLHPGLPDRAVHPRREDRHPLRGHDRDPGLDLFFRKIVRDQFQALTRLGGEIQDFAKGDAGNGRRSSSCSSASRCWPRSARSPRPPTTASWIWTRPPSEALGRTDPLRTGGRPRTRTSNGAPGSLQGGRRADPIRRVRPFPCPAPTGPRPPLVARPPLGARATPYAGPPNRRSEG
jgi:hypothetical protein